MSPLSLFLTSTALADTWIGPEVVTVSSQSKNYVVQVTPGTGGIFGPYDRALTNREHNAAVSVSTVQFGATTLLWQGKLVNPVAPVEVYVSDTGLLTTLDNWHEVGYGPVIVFYDRSGKLIRYWELNELFRPEELVRLPHSVSSIWWHSGKAHYGEGEKAYNLTVPAGDSAFEFDARTGALLSRPLLSASSPATNQPVAITPAPH